MTELWQLYDEQGSPLDGEGANADDILGKGLLHGASHVWIWRRKAEAVQVLLQKRDATKRTWPNFYDISAAGHIDLGEDPLTAAIRETQEEIGLAIAATDLHLISVDRRQIKTPDGQWTENEFCWIFVMEVKEDASFTLDDGEVDSVVWKDFEVMKSEATLDGKYVPHGPIYYGALFESIERLSND